MQRISGSTIGRIFLVFVTMILYQFALVFSVAWLPFDTPNWWIGGAEGPTRHLLFVQLQTTVTLAIYSIPFALVFSMLQKKWALAVATFTALFFGTLQTALSIANSDSGFWWSVNIDLVKQTLTLPLLTFLALRTGLAASILDRFSPRT
jgi:hypothetical protein